MTQPIARYGMRIPSAIENPAGFTMTAGYLQLTDRNLLRRAAYSVLLRKR
jgi:hypothetical protein